MTINSRSPAWATTAVLVGRLIFAAVFLMALAFKVMDIDGTAAYIASAGFPVPKLLAWLAALFELALTVCLLTGLSSLKPRSLRRFTSSSSLLRFMVRRIGAEVGQIRLFRRSLYVHRGPSVLRPRMDRVCGWRSLSAFSGRPRKRELPALRETRRVPVRSFMSLTST